MSNEKILLALLPFWTPLIPPQGLARLKGFLQPQGYRVKTLDANLDKRFNELHDMYFEILRKHIPVNKQGNLYNIGNDVWRDHMMAHLNRGEDDEKYMELVKIIIYQVFFHRLNENQVDELNAVLTDFYNTQESYFLDLLERDKPDVLGLSVYRDNLPASLFAFRLTKREYPHIMTVMGGSVFSIHLPVDTPNLEFFMEKTKDCIDKIIVGEGEKTFLKLLRGELDDSRRLYTTKDIGGNTIGFAPLDMYDFSDFKPGHYHYQGAQASASCPFKCSFCNVLSFYGKYKRKDTAQIVDEMTELHRRHGSQLFYMLDALLNGVMTDLAEEFIRRDITLYWDGYFRVPKSCTKEEALLWRRGGFYRARLGAESGSQKVLDLMGKTITVDQTRETIKNLASAGIKVTAYIVVGHPGETEEDFQKTLDLVEELKDHIWEAECNPFLYYYSGQVQGDEWAQNRRLLYPEWAKDMLITQTWYVEGEPTREVMYDRINRFVEHCRKLGVSIPWSLQGVRASDERWHRLHKNAVPPLFDLMKKEYIDEAKHVKEVVTAQFVPEDEEEFEF